MYIGPPPIRGDYVAGISVPLLHSPLCTRLRGGYIGSLPPQRDDGAGAVGELLFILKKDKKWAQTVEKGSDVTAKSARELLLQIFDALGSGSDVTKKGRRRLANILLM